MEGDVFEFYAGSVLGKTLLCIGRTTDENLVMKILVEQSGQKSLYDAISSRFKPQPPSTTVTTATTETKTGESSTAQTSILLLLSLNAVLQLLK